MVSIIVTLPDNVVVSCGNTDSTVTKAGVNKVLEQKNFVLKMNKNNSDWTDRNRSLRLNH